MGFWWILVYLFIGIIVFKNILRLTDGVCKSSTSLVGKTAIVTGGNSGIGYHTALGLAARGCRVIVASRTSDEYVREKIKKHTNNPNIVVKRLDLSSLSSVRSFAKEIIENEDRLDILVNNAGSVGLGNKYTVDGLHVGMATNHFGSFLLTHLLIDLLKKTAPSRIIFVTSVSAYIRSLTLRNLNDPLENKLAVKTLYGDYRMYVNSKLCNVISAIGFAEKLKGTGVTSNALFPGTTNTNIAYANLTHYRPILKTVRTVFSFFMKTPQQGAQISLILAVSKKLQDITGQFFVDGASVRIPSLARNPEFVRKIWRKSEKLVKLTREERL